MKNILICLFWLVVAVVIVWALICAWERIGEELESDDEGYYNHYF